MKTAINTSAKTKKQGGFIMTTELVLLVTTMVVGMIVGLVTMRDSVVAEMEDVAEASALSTKAMLTTVYASLTVVRLYRAHSSWTTKTLTLAMLRHSLS